MGVVLWGYINFHILLIPTPLVLYSSFFSNIIHIFLMLMFDISADL